MFGNHKRNNENVRLKSEQLRVLYAARSAAVNAVNDADLTSDIRRLAEEDVKHLTELINAIEQNDCKKADYIASKREKTSKIFTSVSMLGLWGVSMYLGIQTDITTKFLPYKSIRAIAKDLSSIVSRRA